MRTRLVIADSSLDQARMEIQASADLMARSFREAYRLVAQTQREVRLLMREEKATAPRAEREAA